MLKTKKQILNENFNIDLSNEFNPLEIKVLKKFYQLYGLDESFDIFDAAALLIEEMELDYQTAFDLVNTFYFNRNRLFSEPEKLKYRTSKAELFFRYLNDFIKEMSEEKESLQIITINTLDGPEDRSISVWELYNKFALYISYSFTQQSNSGLSWDEFRELDRKNTIRVSADFKKLYDKTATYLYNDENFELVLTQRVGEENSDEIIDTIIMPYPESITKQSISELVENVWLMTKNYAEKTIFNVNKLPDLQSGT